MVMGRNLANVLLAYYSFIAFDRGSVKPTYKI